MRWVVLLVAAVVACERRPAHETQPQPVVRDARPPIDGMSGPDANLAQWLDTLEPTDPPLTPIARPHAHGDCRPDFAPRPNRDPYPMCKVDGGTFTLSADAAKAAGVSGKVTLEPFYIDQFEVTAAQYARFLNVHGNHCPGFSSPDHDDACVVVDHGDDRHIQRVIEEVNGRFRPIAGAEDRPASPSIAGSLRYCAWAGKQLASEAQWEYAARHDPRTGRDLKYPWGDRFDANRFWNQPEHGPYERGDVLPVGTFDGTAGHGDGSSPWGVHDMAGNGPEAAVRCETPDVGGAVDTRCPLVLRGLVDADSDIRGRGSELVRGGFDDYGVFRCALSS